MFPLPSDNNGKPEKIPAGIPTSIAHDAALKTSLI